MANIKSSSSFILIYYLHADCIQYIWSNHLCRLYTDLLPPITPETRDFGIPDLVYFSVFYTLPLERGYSVNNLFIIVNRDLIGCPAMISRFNSASATMNMGVQVVIQWWDWFWWSLFWDFSQESINVFLNLSGCFWFWLLVCSFV